MISPSETVEIVPCHTLPSMSLGTSRRPNSMKAGEKDSKQVSCFARLENNGNQLCTAAKVSL